MMVARVLVGCITLLSLPCLAAAQPGVTVKLVGNELVAVPGYIVVADVTGSGLRVSSEVGDLECFIQLDPSGPAADVRLPNADKKHGGQGFDCEGLVTAGVQQYLVFRSGERIAMVALIQPPRQVGIGASLLLVLLSMGIAALAIALTRTPPRTGGTGGAGGRETHSDPERLIGEVRDLRQRIKSLVSPSSLPPISPSALIGPVRAAPDQSQSEQRQSDRQPPDHQQPDRRTAERSPAEENLQRVLDAAVAWSTTIDRVPESFREAYRRLENLRGRAEAYPPVFLNQSTHLARTALNHSDSHSDPRFEQRAIQDALTHLIAATGLTLISPSRLDLYDEDLHDVVGRDPSPDLPSRNTVSRVNRRGLRRADAIVSRAEVCIYD
jgi:hypothetical protein